MTSPAPGTPEALAAAIIGVNHLLAPVLEATNGYRAQLVEAGYGKQAAESMAADYHRHVLAAVFSGQK